MQRRRPKVLVLADEKSTAEAITRGLGGLAEIEPELELAFERDVVRRQLRDRRYDLLVLERHHLTGNGESLAHDIPDDVPVVAVGGRPSDPVPGGPHVRGVPLPLSFSLFARAVRESLFPEGAEEGEPERRLRDLG